MPALDTSQCTTEDSRPAPAGVLAQSLSMLALLSSLSMPAAGAAIPASKPAPSSRPATAAKEVDFRALLEMIDKAFPAAADKHGKLVRLTDEAIKRAKLRGLTKLEEVPLAEAITEFLARPKIKIIDIGAVWCGGCRTGYPGFASFAGGRQNIEFGLLIIEEELGSKTENRIPWLPGLKAFPMTLVLDGDGEVLAATVGGQNSGALAKYLEKLQRAGYLTADDKPNSGMLHGRAEFQKALAGLSDRKFSLVMLTEAQVGELKPGAAVKNGRISIGNTLDLLKLVERVTARPFNLTVVARSVARSTPVQLTGTFSVVDLLDGLVTALEQGGDNLDAQAVADRRVLAKAIGQYRSAVAIGPVIQRQISVSQEFSFKQTGSGNGRGEAGNSTTHISDTAGFARFLSEQTGIDIKFQFPKGPLPIREMLTPQDAISLPELLRNLVKRSRGQFTTNAKGNELGLEILALPPILPE